MSQHRPNWFFAIGIVFLFPAILADCRAEAQEFPSRDCVADCNGDGVIPINELLLAVRAALDEDAVFACMNADPNDSGTVEIGELIRGAVASLHGCSHRCGDSILADTEDCEHVDPYPVFCGTCRSVGEDGRVRVGDYTCTSACNCDVPDSSDCQRWPRPR